MFSPERSGLLQHVFEDLTSGRGQLRLIIQPVVAIFLGMRLGKADARARESPFLWRLATETHNRSALFKHSLSDVLLPLCVAIVIDSILQHFTLDHVRPLGSVLVGLLLVWLPYSISRALTNRIVRRGQRAATTA